MINLRLLGSSFDYALFKFITDLQITIRRDLVIIDGTHRGW